MMFWFMQHFLFKVGKSESKGETRRYRSDATVTRYRKSDLGSLVSIDLSSEEEKN